MNRQSVFKKSLDFFFSEKEHENRFPKKFVEIELTNRLLCSDAGLLPIRQLDETLKLIEQFVDALHDSRRQIFGPPGRVCCAHQWCFIIRREIAIRAHMTLQSWYTSVAYSAVENKNRVLEFPKNSASSIKSVNYIEEDSQ